MSKNFHPLISIVMPVYNGSNYMRQAIDSALSQTYDNFEVIVVNDGSTDNGKTDQICKSYGDKISYIKKENGGVASALNRGIKEMKGEYFSWLSHDDVYYPEKLEKQVEFLSTLKNKKVILYSNVAYIDQDSMLIRKTEYEKIHDKKALNTRLYPALKGMMNGCVLLIPREFLLDFGGFDEKLKTSNDYDMWFKISRKFDLRFQPDVLIKYRLHEEQGTRTEEKYYDEANALWSKTISDIKPSEILKFEKSLFKFYADMYLQMKKSHYLGASKIAFKLAKKYYKPENPKVSILMAAYNTEDYIAEAIESILNQTYPDFELIIIDDNSTDNTKKIINKYKKEDFRIRYSENMYRKGVAGAINTGLDLAKGKYITRMDSDDISVPKRLERQVSFLENNDKYDICSANLSAFGARTTGGIYREQEAPYKWLFLWQNPIPNAPTMYRSSVIRENNLRLNNYIVASDYDFFCRMVLHGKVHFIEEVLYKYRIHSESIFQKNQDTVMETSLEINSNFIKNFTNNKIPSIHKYLTVFMKNENPEEIDILEALEWMNLLLEKTDKYFKWSPEEIIEIKKDIRKRIETLMMTDSLENIVTENSSLKIELSKLKNSYSWKLTKPLRFIAKKSKSILKKVRKLFANK